MSRFYKCSRAAVLMCSVLFLVLCLSGVYGKAQGAEDFFLLNQGFEDFNMESPVTVYNRSNLFGHINGEAEVYLPLGFRFLYLQSHRKQDTGVIISVEAYDMSSPEGAMDIFENYSQYGGAKLKGFTEQAWSDEYRVLFYNGGYFMQVMPDPTAELDEEPNLEEMVALAKQLDRALSQQLK